MQKLAFFVLKYQKILFGVLALLQIPPLTLISLLLDLPLPVYALICVVWTVTLLFLLIQIGAQGFRAGYVQLTERCDPTLLYWQTKEVLDGPKFQYISRGLIAIDHGVALSSRGQKERNLQLLASFTEADIKRLGKYLSVQYYHNLSSAYHNTGDFENAEIYYQKMLEAYEVIREKKTAQRIYGDFLPRAEATHLRRLGEYEKAAEILREVKCVTVYDKVWNAFQLAECDRNLGRLAEAREKLRYVAENGNKLYIAEEAKTLLAAMNEA